jgi:hypothetical protein
MDLFKDATRESAVGEASPSYLFYDNTAQKINKYIPKCKIIIVLRDPAERLHSDYFHSMRIGKLTDPFRKFVEPLIQKSELRKDSVLYNLFRRGFYSNDVNNYIDIFGRERIFIGLFEDLKSNPKEFMEKIFRFLNVSDEYVLDYSQIHNPGGVRIIPFLPRLINNSRTILKPILSKFIPSYNLFKLRKSVLALNTSSKKPDLDPEIKKIIINLYRDEILKLQELINLDLSGWLE